jgi:hypothetical protein
MDLIKAQVVVGLRESNYLYREDRQDPCASLQGNVKFTLCIQTSLLGYCFASGFIRRAALAR